MLHSRSYREEVYLNERCKPVIGEPFVWLIYTWWIQTVFSHSRSAIEQQIYKLITRIQQLYTIRMTWLDPHEEAKRDMHAWEMGGEEEWEEDWQTGGGLCDKSKIKDVHAGMLASRQCWWWVKGEGVTRGNLPLSTPQSELIELVKWLSAVIHFKIKALAVI